MSARYVIFLHSEAAAFFYSLRGGDKEPVRRFLDLLEEQPHLAGETTERDETGRTVQVKVVGKLKVTYWPDHGAKEVKILSIERWRRA